jgi:hypothetical protein
LQKRHINQSSLIGDWFGKYQFSQHIVDKYAYFLLREILAGQLNFRRSGIRENRKFPPGILDCSSGIPMAQSNAIADIPKTSFTASIHPNPVSNGKATLYYHLEKDLEITLTIHDMTGKVIYQQDSKWVQGDNTVPLDFKGIAAGMYLLRVQHADGGLSLKVVVD